MPKGLAAEMRTAPIGSTKSRPHGARLSANSRTYGTYQARGRVAARAIRRDCMRMRQRQDGVLPAACAIAVMGKASAPGRTKTRLVPPLSGEEAARLNTAFLQDVMGNLIAAGRVTEIAPYVAYGPAGSEAFFRGCLPENVDLIECCLPNFGDCLRHALTTMLARGHSAACVLNADSPTLPTRCLIDAARTLAHAPERIVIGPSTDGGYYLLGLTHVHARLFADIEWSSPRVCEQTRQRAAELDLAVTLLEPWYDVDDAAALRRLHADLARADDCKQGASDAIYGARQTRAALARVAAQPSGTPTSAAVERGAP
jgi:rSAM/selenodomain-associated transferase 1